MQGDYSPTSPMLGDYSLTSPCRVITVPRPYTARVCTHSALPGTQDGPPARHTGIRHRGQLPRREERLSILALQFPLI